LTSNVTDDAGPSDAGLLALLSRIENESPRLTSAILTREVDSLLGRAPARATRPSRAEDFEDDRRPPSTTFEWYQPIVAALPPVLDSEQTVAAAMAIEAGLFAQERLSHVDPAAVTRTHLRQLHILVEEGEAAFRLLTLSNLRLVFHWAKGVAQSLGEDWVQDAFQVGCMGLMRGLQGWDYTMGYALSTYVSWHIRQAIQRWRANEVTLIRIPVHVWEKLASDADDLSTEIRNAAVRAQDVASLDELAEEYLDDPVRDDVHDSLIWDGGLAAAASQVDRFRLVDALLGTLTEREAAVIRLRCGLDSTDSEPMTLDAIGQVFDVTRERIRQIERKALTKMREHADARGLRYVP
jgi:RNA polymerase primary sigma factor